MEETILRDFIIIRRDQFRSYESGDITFSEFITYIWLCRISDKYGVAHVRSYSWLAEQLPIDVKPNTVGVLLRSLRNHNLIAYSDRKGSRSGFKVTIGFWPLGNGQFRTLSDVENDEGPLEELMSRVSESQVVREAVPKNHKSSTLFNSSKTVGFEQISTTAITGYKMNMETDIDIKNGRKANKKMSVSDFVPESDNDDKLQRIAQTVGESHMGFVFWIYGKKGEEGIRVMERVAVDLIDKPDIANKRAYFNSEVRRRLDLSDESEVSISIDLG